MPNIMGELTEDEINERRLDEAIAILRIVDKVLASGDAFQVGPKGKHRDLPSRVAVLLIERGRDKRRQRAEAAETKRIRAAARREALAARRTDPAYRQAEESE